MVETETPCRDTSTQEPKTRKICLRMPKSALMA